MSIERAVRGFQDLGMSGYEAKAYVALVSAGTPLNGYEAAKRSGVPRSTVYETLSKLVSRGAAYEVRDEDGSTAYLPLPADRFLDRLSRDFDASVNGLRGLLPSVTAPSQVHLIHNIGDPDSLIARAQDVVAGARWDLFVSSFPEELEPLWPLLSEAEQRRVDITLMSFGEPSQTVGHSFTHRYSSPEVVVTNLGCRLLVVVGDRREAIIGGLHNSSAWGVYTDNPAVVMLAVEYIRHDVAMHVIADHMPEAALEEFWTSDPELQRLRSDPGTPGRAPGPDALRAALADLGR